MYNLARARPLASALRAAAVCPRTIAGQLQKPLTPGCIAIESEG